MNPEKSDKKKSVIGAFRGPYRLEMCCTVTFDGPLHIGSGQQLSVKTDSPILRDHQDNPYIPGSGIRGVLRDFCEREAIVHGVPRTTVIRLFGPDSAESNGNDTYDRRGRLTVNDAKIIRKNSSEIRDHVKINPETAAAFKGGKFDDEVLVDLKARFSLVYEGDGQGDEELVLLEAIKNALEQDRCLFFGAKGGWGYGAILEAKVTTSAINRGDEEGLIKYLKDRITNIEQKPDNSILNGNLENRSGRELDTIERDGDKKLCIHPWCWLSIEADLQFDGPMLVAGPLRGKDKASEARKKADDVYVANNGTPYLPGSSLRGAMQAHARRIAETLKVNNPIGDSLFGTLKGDSGRRGLVHIGEGRFIGKFKSEKHEIFMDHVAIDRLTGFAATSQLFNTCALASPRFRHRFFIRWKPDDKEQMAAAALFLFTLRDMQAGLIWVGSRTTRGYGYLPSINIGKVILSNVRKKDKIYTREQSDISLSGKNISSEWSDNPVVNGLITSWTSKVNEKSREKTHV